ncbi:MAG: hypothetical protein H0V82_06880 [Candidatus Protochlamydia sp.]|nr:hypothetical protein [Candidatus Protochlamydia sp.]
MNINSGSKTPTITRVDDHSVKFKPTELAYLGKATSSKVRQFFESFLHVISFTLYDPTSFYEAKGKQVVLQDNIEVMEKDLIKNKTEKREKTNKKIGKNVNVKEFMNFLKTKKIFPDDTLVNYSERKDVVDHLRLLFKLQKAGQDMFKGLIKPEELENLTSSNPENVNRVKDLNKIRLLVKYENIDERKSSQINPASVLGLLKIALNEKLLIDVNKKDIESFDVILQDYRGLPSGLREEIDQLLLTPQGSSLVKLMLSLYKKTLPEEASIRQLTHIINFKNSNGIANAQFLAEQIDQNPNLRDILKNISNEIGTHPDFGKHLAKLSQSVKTFNELKIGKGNVGERFFAWLSGKPPQNINELESAPERFIQYILTSKEGGLRESGGEELVSYYQEKISQSQGEDYEKVLHEIFSLEEGLAKITNLFKEIGFEKNIQSHLVAELKRGEKPEAILSNLIESAQEIDGRIERYSNLKLADGSSVADAFKAYMRETDLVQNPILSDIEKKFNLDQWNGVKDLINSEKVKENVEKSIVDGKFHYTEIKEFIAYREFTNIIAELSQPTGLLGRLKNVFGFFELSNIVNALLSSHKDEGTLDSVISILKPLNDLQKQYHRFGLSDQFQEQSNVFFSQDEIQKNTPAGKIEKFLQEQEAISKAFVMLDAFQVQYFSQNDLKQQFDTYITKSLSIKLQKGETLQNALESLIDESKEIGPNLDSLYNIKTYLPPEMKSTFEANLSAAFEKYLNKGYPLNNAVITISRNLLESERLDPQDLFRLKEKDFGTLFTDKYLSYAQRGVKINNKEKIYLDDEKFMQSTPEEQISQIVPLLTQELNNQAFVPLFKEAFVKDYLGAVPGNIDNRILRLHHLASVAERHQANGFAPPTTEQFEQFIRDFDNHSILTNILVSSDLQNKNINELFAYYIKNNQDGRLTVLMETLGSSSTFVKALSGKNQKRLDTNLKALIPLSEYFLNFHSKGSYDPRDVASGMRFLLKEKSGKNLNFNPVAEALSNWSNKIMYHDMEKDLFEQTFKAFVTRVGSAGILTREGTDKFISGVTALFDEKKIIPDKAALELAKQIIEKSRNLILEGYEPTAILNSLLSQKSKGTLIFNLKEMKEAPLIDATYSEIKKELQIPLLNNNAVFNAVQQNPFKAVTKLLPVFIEQILPENNKHRALELESRLRELEKVAIKLPTVQNAGRKMAYAGALVNGLLPELHKDGGKVVLDTSKRIGERIKEEIENVGNPNKLTELKLKPKIAKPDTSIEQMQLAAVEGAVDGAIYLLDGIIKAQKIRLKLKENDIQLDQVQLTGVESFLLETLPGLPYGKIKLGLTFASPLLWVLDVSNSLGEQMAKLAVKAYLRTSSNELSSEEQNFVAESIPPVVKILALAGPAVLKNHNVDGYLNFMQHVNELIQSPELITKEQENELHFEILTVMGQFIEELTPYENALDQAGKAMADIK